VETFKLAKQVEDQVIHIRRHLHEYPEISMEEENTIAFVTNKLKEIGIPYEVVPKGGIIGVIEGRAGGKSLILRAELDALPMQEAETNLSQQKVVISQIADVAHTCGHDAHMAMLLGSAKILYENRKNLNGKVLLAFEQGEEMGGGIYALLKRLTEIGADGIWGVHVKNDLPSGKISVDPGPRMAGFFPFHVKITGKSGHGSRPDLASSPIDCFTHFHQQLTAMRLTSLNPHDPITISIGSVSSGSALNIIPDSLQFSGTARFLNYKQGQSASKEFKRLLATTCNLHSCTYEYILEPIAKDLLVYNQEQCAEIARKSITTSMGKEMIATFPAWMASEPFAYYQKYFPGVFAFLGIKNEAKGTGAEHHNIHFDIDEHVMKIGVAATVQYTIDFLKYNDQFHFVPENRSVEALFENN